MANIIEITDIADPRLDVYARLTEAQLCDRLHADCGTFIAESPKVIASALDCGFQPLSLLCEHRHIAGDAREIIARMPDEIPLYTASRDTLTSLTGYKLTRGVLCAMRRRKLPTAEEVCAGATRVAVIDGVCDTTNIGAIFRSAAALGIDAVLLTRTSCDPLNRRAIRVSMGTVFRVPWTWIDDPIEDLRKLGFTTVALAIRDDSVSIDSPELADKQRLALILGTEGDGLSSEVIHGADIVARIPMSRGVDSLNVAAASAVAFWQLRKRF